LKTAAKTAARSRVLIVMTPSDPDTSSACAVLARLVDVSPASISPCTFFESIALSAHHGRVVQAVRVAHPRRAVGVQRLLDLLGLELDTGYSDLSPAGATRRGR
jgi:hypothetical protein